ncbi:hypothetical protein FRC11_011835 [Ceratobasidium sp. 423]|nr:hypothetical protein FRC11_011835 [Ceratobasidium sp. 423]
MRAHVGRVKDCKNAEKAQTQPEPGNKTVKSNHASPSSPTKVDVSPPISPGGSRVPSDVDDILDQESMTDDDVTVTEVMAGSESDNPSESGSADGRSASVDRESTRSPPVGQAPQTHGFAIIEVHPRRVRVLRWVPPNDDETNEESLERLLWQRDVFRLAEWLANMKGTDRDRQAYFTFQVHENNLPWDNLDEMYTAIDTFALTPGWTHEILRVSVDGGEEILDVYMRDILEVIRFLIGLRRLRDHIHYSSEKHWTYDRQGRRIRAFDELWSGEWWWRIQYLIPIGGVAVPVLVATDPTQLTMIAGDKYACPVYATIGNISKDIRAKPSEHVWVLIGYLPVARLAFIENADRRREKKWDVYHAAMAMIMEPLKVAGEEGIEAVCADGGVRRIYPILTVKIADWPERCTGACSQATRCPVCTIDFRNRGSLVVAPLRTKHQTTQLLLDSRAGYQAERKEAGLRPTWPYWAQLPFANGAHATVPDPLHQIHKGLFKAHLFEWWQNIIGKVELNNRYRALPRSHGVRYFPNGPCSISQWTGIEAREAEKPFLPIIASHTSYRAVFATRVLMDFFFRLHQGQLDENDLARMDEDLRGFHANKDIFRRLEAFLSRWGWNGIAKLHMASHFTHQIREYGTPDNYDTEIPERLHRHYVKNPYRQCSKSGNIVEQMIIRLQRRENWVELRSKLERAGLIEELKFRATSRLAGDVERCMPGLGPGLLMDADGNWTCGRDRHVYKFSPRIFIGQRPLERRMSVADIIHDFEAPGFTERIAEYLDDIQPGLSYQVDDRSCYAVWRRCELHHDPLPFAPLEGDSKDVIRAQPVTIDRAGRVTRPSYFDCALILSSAMHQGLFRK